MKKCNSQPRQGCHYLAYVNKMKFYHKICLHILTGHEFSHYSGAPTPLRHGKN
jgi:hypothetical protein